MSKLDDLKPFRDSEDELLYEDEYKNKTVGIFEIWGRREEKAPDGHALYKGKCLICGTVINSIQIRQAKNVKECIHLNTRWENPRISKIYWDIIKRCYKKENRGYRWYGAKGIKVCDEWLKDPSSFEKWALENGYQDNLSIDRKDETKDYCPENCWWIPLEENSRFKSTTTLIEFEGETYTGRQLAEKLNLGINTINKFLREFSEKDVKKFIELRIKNPNVKRKSHQTWFNAYGIEGY